MIGEALFGSDAAVLRHRGMERRVAGFAVWFINFRPSAAVRDLSGRPVRRPAQRGKGIGKALLSHLAKRAWRRLVAVAMVGAGLETPSIEFYKSLGAELMDEWTVCKVPVRR